MRVKTCNKRIRVRFMQSVQRGSHPHPDSMPVHHPARSHQQYLLGYSITKYVRQARLADISPHGLRHRFEYRMAEAVPLHRLAQITNAQMRLGNSSTFQNYCYTSKFIAQAGAVSDCSGANYNGWAVTP